MSLYSLELAEKYWERCKYFANRKNYPESFGNYLRNEWKKKASNGLKSCTSLEELVKIDENAQKNREERINERNNLYELFQKYPSEIKNIGYYTLFIEENQRLIDFDKWKGHDSYCSLIEEIKQIQPKIAK